MVMDFGLAKVLREDPEIQRLTRSGIVLGTPEFMSPEQLETVIAQALAQKREDRFQSMEELRAGFASVTAKTGVSGRLFG